MRRLESRAFSTSLFALTLVACGGDDTVADSISGGATQGTAGDATDSQSTTGGDADGTADASGAATMGTATGGTMSGGVDSTGDSQGPTTNSTSSTSMGADDSDSGTTGGNGPGVVPSEYPGVDVGLCTPPGLIQYCYSGDPRTYNEGECGPGTQECQALDLDLGEWSDCEGESLPQMEICDGLDNDCDGQVDEDQGFTMCGIGLCEHTVPNCLKGQPVFCDPFEGATPEVCDSIDNDCDGDIDEGLGDEEVTCGIGLCEHTVTGCEGGMVPSCDPFQGAMPEICNDIDDDCDGQVDEGFGDQMCGCGICAHTEPACINGVVPMCDPFQGAMPEVCDGVDNDCDCMVDEEQPDWVCGENECQVTAPSCIAGVPQAENTCEPTLPGAEICGNGIDDNCDGIAPPCAEGFLVGTDTTVRPIVVLWAVDSSASMAEEMALVEQEINDFATQLSSAGSATSLHLIADRRDTEIKDPLDPTDDFTICVSPPLGNANCADNPAANFWQYDSNMDAESMVHSSNALGRIAQQAPFWLANVNLAEDPYVAVIVTTDDNGDDPSWTAADGDPCDVAACDECTSTSTITQGTTGDICRAFNPFGGPAFASLAFDHAGLLGFSTFMDQVLPAGYSAGTDWAFYPIIGTTGTAVLSGADDVFEFNDCSAGGTNPTCQCVEAGEEYVKLAQLTSTLPSMFSICELDWDASLNALANDIVSGVPNDTYVLAGSPDCAMIDPATIVVSVNGIPLAAGDWIYDAMTCTLQVVNNIPVVGDNVVIVYDNL